GNLWRDARGAGSVSSREENRQEQAARAARRGPGDAAHADAQDHQGPAQASGFLKRFLQPFVLVVSAMLAAAYAYLAWRLATGAWERVALAAPFFLIWIVPVYYWGSDREDQGIIDQLAHQASYLSMAWLSFALVLTLARDALLVLTLPL